MLCFSEINLGLYNIHCSCIKAALIDEDVVFVYDGISTMYTNKELTQYKVCLLNAMLTVYIRLR